MSDIIDKANDLVSMMNEFVLRDVRNKSIVDEAPPTGWCLYCGEVVLGSRRWCDSECRDGWEAEKRRTSYGE